MTDPRELLDARLAAYAREDACDFCADETREDMAPKVFAALRAVLAEHPQVIAYEDDRLYCRGCNDLEGEMRPWPCPTVQAIIRELEGK